METENKDVEEIKVGDLATYLVDDVVYRVYAVTENEGVYKVGLKATETFWVDRSKLRSYWSRSGDLNKPAHRPPKKISRIETLTSSTKFMTPEARERFNKWWTSNQERVELIKELCTYIDTPWNMTDDEELKATADAVVNFSNDDLQQVISELKDFGHRYRFKDGHWEDYAIATEGTTAPSSATTIGLVAGGLLAAGIFKIVCNKTKKAKLKKVEESQERLEETIMEKGNVK